MAPPHPNLHHPINKKSCMKPCVRHRQTKQTDTTNPLYIALLNTRCKVATTQCAAYRLAPAALEGHLSGGRGPLEVAQCLAADLLQERGEGQVTIRVELAVARVVVRRVELLQSLPLSAWECVFVRVCVCVCNCV